MIDAFNAVKDLAVFAGSLWCIVCSVVCFMRSVRNAPFTGDGWSILAFALSMLGMLMVGK